MIKAKLNLAYRYDNHSKLDKETDPGLDESPFGDWTNDPHTLVANLQYQSSFEHGPMNLLCIRASLGDS